MKVLRYWVYSIWVTKNSGNKNGKKFFFLCCMSPPPFPIDMPAFNLIVKVKLFTKEKSLDHRT